MTHRLHAAIRQGCIEDIAVLLKEEPGAVARRDSHQNTALHLAARRCDAGIVRMLAWACPMAKYLTNMFGDLPLHQAALHANPAALGVLLHDHPEGLRMPNYKGNTPLHAAAASRQPGQLETFRTLFFKAPDLATKGNAAGDTPGHLAARSGNLGALKLMAGKMGDVLSTANRNGHLPLHAAIEAYVCQRDDIVWGSNTADLPLKLADTVVFLLRYTRTCKDATMAELGRQCTGGDDLEPTVLHTAAYLRHEHVVRLVLRRDPSAAVVRDSFENYPVHLAASSGAPGIVSALLDAAPNTANGTNDSGETPLHCAAESFNPWVVEILLEAAHDTASAVAADGSTPTHMAARSNNPRGLELLLQAAPHTAEVPDVDGSLPVFVAAANGRHAAVDLLMRAAPHTAHTITHGFNALHIAAMNAWEEAVDTLLKHDPSLAGARTDAGSSALHLTIHPDIYDDDATMLVREDAIVAPIVRSLVTACPALASEPGTLLLANGVSLGGCVPLHIAAAFGMEHCVEELLKCAPETVHCLNAGADTPMEFALRNGHRGVARQLLMVRAQNPEDLLRRLLALAPTAPGLFVTAIAHHMPLSCECWELVPRQLDGLLSLLPAALDRGTPLDTRQLLARLSPVDMRFFMTALACLRIAAPYLPSALVTHIVRCSVAS